MLVPLSFLNRMILQCNIAVLLCLLVEKFILTSMASVHFEQARRMWLLNGYECAHIWTLQIKCFVHQWSSRMRGKVRCCAPVLLSFVVINVHTCRYFRHEKLFATRNGQRLFLHGLRLVKAENGTSSLIHSMLPVFCL
jgi:hypothetical protein